MAERADCSVDQKGSWPRADELEDLRQIFDSVGGAHCLVEDGTKLIRASPAFRELWGKHAKSGRRTDWAPLVEPEDRHVFLLLPEKLTDDAPAVLDYRMQVGDEVRWVRETCVRVSDPSRDRTCSTFVDVTERHESAEVQGKLEAAIESGQDCLALLDDQDRFLYVNGQYCRLHGYEPDELLGQTWRICYGPEQRARLERVVMPVLQGEAVWSGELLGRRRDGSEFEQLACFRSLKSGGMILNCRDVSEHVAMVELASETQHRLLLALQSAGAGTWSWSVENDRMICEGYPHPVFSGRSGVFYCTPSELFGAIHHEDRERVRARIREVFAEEERFHARYRVVHPDGSHRWIVDQGRVHRREDGRAVRMTGICLDVTREVEAEREVERQRSFLRQVIDSNPNLIFAKDRHGRYTLANRATAELHGTTPAELIGCTASDFCDDETIIDTFRRHDDRVLSSGLEAFIPEETVTDAHGRVRYLQTVIRPLHDDDGSIEQVLGVSTDVTQRKQAERKRIELESQLLQAQKIDSIGQLAGGLAHDLNNLLTPVIAHASVLLEELPPADSIRSDLEEIQAAGNRAVQLTRQLLAFGRKQVLSFETIELNDSIVELEQFIGRLLPETMQLEVELDPDVGCVRADPTQLQQVLVNLVINARDAMEHGVLTVATLPGQDRPTDEAPHGFEILEVRDHGSGIAPEHFDRVFEPFFTTKQVGRGTGLGLSTCHGIVRQHGGRIGIESEPGEGTVVRVLLPRAAEGATSSPRESRAPTQVERSETESGTVLVVEDEPVVRRSIARVLRKRGYEVLEAGTPERALTIADDLAGEIDLLLSDLVLPTMTGLELHGLLEQRHGRMRVAFTSGYSQETARLVADRPFLAKPFSTDQLVAIVREALGEPMTSSERA
ncbi:MAG: PAS domain S-box protein [Acidobacteriota bacterium]